MTDESKFRAPRPLGQPQPSTAASTRVRRTEDPLAELARLIGQEDPFADFVAHRPADARSAGNLGIQRRTRPQEGRGYDGRPAERVERRRPLPRTPEPSSDEADAQEIPEAPHTNGRGAYAYGGSRPVPGTDDLPPAQRSHRDDGARALSRSQPRADVRGVDALHEHERLAPADARHARRAPARPANEDPAYDQYAGTDYDPDYVDDAYIPAHGDEFYEEAPRRRVKTWLLAGISAVALVVLGASGLFAYRAVFGVTNSGAPPVTIRSEAGPTKMVPGSTTKAAEAGGNKQIYDRVGGDQLPSGERIVSREERPIDSGSAAPGAAATRMPGGTVAAVPPTSPAPPAPAPAAPAPTEPRRAPTATVRADGTVVSDPARSAPPAPAQRAGTAPAANAPLALSGQSSTPALPPARPSSSAAQQQSDNPWASVTNSGQLSAPTPTSQAALTPQSTPGAAPTNPPPIVAVQQPAPAGSYVVQVAAQKSEAEAAATWQQLQQRYAAVLGAQQASIRRVDLGERGVFYRAQVGPFASRSQASEVCQSLKAAGGECVIQRN
ncbi:MAG: SPOR domain-containing protein [Xanthobacteraceae bacterium]